MQIQDSIHPASLLRRLPLAACLATACSLSLSTQGATTGHATRTGHTPNPTPMTRTVDTCLDDDSPNSLRSLVTLANEDDTIDLAHLPAGCGRIILDSTHVPPYLKVTRNSLHLQGPGADALTIDGNSNSSVLRHAGAIGMGALHISGLTIANGMHVSNTDPKGGCVYSSGDVELVDSVVTGCEVLGTGATMAAGGGIHARGYLKLTRTSVTDNDAKSLVNAFAGGGGVAVYGGLFMGSSSITNNLASGNAGSFGGGAFVLTPSTLIESNVRDSTISNNNAGTGGGIYAYDVYIDSKFKITQSTISGNRAGSVGGIATTGNLAMVDSTIAFNQDTAAFSPGAGAVFGNVLQLDNSILSGNFGRDGASDLGSASFAPIQGTHNVIVATALATPFDTTSGCPRLQPLGNNGGLTLTHKPKHDSPVIDNGNDPLNFGLDQTGHQRTVGATVDIGAVEWDNVDDELLLKAGFDGICDL
jgi:hypothetical protein